MQVRTAGFTLTQTLLVAAILAVLLALALPSLKRAIASVHASTARGDMIESLMASSRHALAAQRNVILCPSQDGASCTEGSTDWSNGWIAYLDENGTRERSSTGPIILRKPSLKGSTRLLSSTGRTRLVFQPRGDNAGSNVTFTLCDRHGAIRASTLVLANTGRWRSAVPSPEAAQACENGG